MVTISTINEKQVNVVFEDNSEMHFTSNERKTYSVVLTTVSNLPRVQVQSTEKGLIKVILDVPYQEAILINL